MTLNSCVERVIKPDYTGAVASLPIETIGNGAYVLIQSDSTLTNDRIWLLDGIVRFKNALLTIEPGTVIKGSNGLNGSPGTLILDRSSTLNAVGTANAPIVFTSAQPSGQRQPGDWGGIIWCGSSFVNVKAGTNGTPINYLGQISNASSASGFIRYGNGVGTPGTNATDSRGRLSFVRIEYAGQGIDENLGALTLAGLGNGTIIDHIQVSHSSGDGIVWLGGTVDQKYILANCTIGNDMVVDQGYLGRTQFGIILQDYNQINFGIDGGIYSRGSDVTAKNLIFFTDPVFSHITNLGAYGINCSTVPSNPDFDNGVFVTERSKIDLFNSVIAGYPRYQVFYDFINDYNNKLTQMQGNRLVSPVLLNASLSNLEAIQITNRQNEGVKATSCSGILSISARTGIKPGAWDVTNPDLTLEPESRLLTGAIYQHPRYNNNNCLGAPPFVIPCSYGFQDPTFFDRPSFRGAMGETTGGWQLDLWAEFNPQSNMY